MSYRIAPREDSWSESIYVVGCGGTGSLVADGLCRLLIGRDSKITLVDHDRVEPHNLLRQNYYAGDVGRFKSQALAERLSRLYGRPVRYSVVPFEQDLTRESFSEDMETLFTHGMIIGCVDNSSARKEISRAFGDAVDDGLFWIDAGNGHQFGQVLVGNTTHPERVRGTFNEALNTASVHTGAEPPGPVPGRAPDSAGGAGGLRRGSARRRAVAGN